MGNISTQTNTGIEFFVVQDLKINSFVNSQPLEALPTSRNSPVTKIPIACTPNFPNVPVKKVNPQLFLAICVGVELWLWHQINVGGGKVQSFLLFIETTSWFSGLKIPCPYCERTMHQRSLQRHIQTQHTETNPIQCELCSEVFRHQGNLKDHIRRKHKIYKTKNYV